MIAFAVTSLDPPFKIFAVFCLPLFSRETLTETVHLEVSSPLPLFLEVSL